MDNEKLMKFGQDLFKLCGERGLPVTGLGEENGEFYMETPDANAEAGDFGEVLKELLGESDKWEVQKSSFDPATDLYRFNFTMEEDILDSYDYEFEVHEFDVKELDILEENKDKKVKRVEGPKDNIIYFDDDSVQIDLDAWEFTCIDKKVANMLRPMANIGFLQSYDWTTLVGHFLADDEYKPNELITTGSQTGRWAVKGISPFGKEYLYILHDDNAGDLPLVQSKSDYGLHEMSEWYFKKYKDHTLEIYEREVELSDGTIEKYGVDVNGEAYATWNRCGWLKELGL